MGIIKNAKKLKTVTKLVYLDPPEWLMCSENCGIGDRSRTRVCTSTGGVCPTEGGYESEPCQIQECLTCENFNNYCDSKVNTECIDTTVNGEPQAQCQCKNPWGLDEFGDCKKCNALRPFNWQCHND